MASLSKSARVAAVIAALWLGWTVWTLPGVYRSTLAEMAIGQDLFEIAFLGKGASPAEATARARAEVERKALSSTLSSVIWWGVGPSLALMLCFASVRARLRSGIWGAFFGAMAVAAHLKGFSDTGEVGYSVRAVTITILVALVMLVPVAVSAPWRRSLWKQKDMESQWRASAEREQSAITGVAQP